MYEIIFYEKSNGTCELADYIDKLIHGKTKDDRIKLKQLTYYIDVLKIKGTRAGEPIVKFIEDEIWELRPGENRVFFFLWYENKIVLLHRYRKESEKAPRHEIDQAKAEARDWLSRYNQK